MNKSLFAWALLASLSNQAVAQTDELFWSKEPWILAKTPDTFFEFGYGCHLYLPSGDAELHIFFWVNASEIVVYDPRLGLPESSGSLTLQVFGTEQGTKMWPAEYGGAFGRVQQGPFLVDTLRDLVAGEPTVLEVVMPDGTSIGTFVAPEFSTVLDHSERCIKEIQW
jgi:hypothetical protein